MVLVLIAIAGGFLVGRARGGRLHHLVRLRLGRSRLLGSALGARVLGVLAGWWWAPAESLLTALAVGFLALFAWVNRRVQGVALVGLGIVLHAVAGFAPDRLGEVVPVAFPGRPETLTPGEVVIAAGLGLLVVTAMTAAAPAARRATIGAGADQQEPART